MRRCLVSVLVVLCTVSAWAVERSTPIGLRLDLEQVGGLNRLFVAVSGQQGAERILLRESRAAIRPGRTGGDPAGLAVFATWEEDGLPWSSFSRDAGARWSEARPFESAIRLRQAAVEPTDPMPLPAAGLEVGAEGRVVLVQFRTISLPEWRATLRQAGAEILSFFPHAGHLLRLPPQGDAVLASIASLDFVERIEPYHPSYRLEHELRDWIADPQSGPETLRVRVQAFEWGPRVKQRIADAALAAGAGIVTLWPAGHIVELDVDREQLRLIAGHDDVSWIDRWTPAEADMDLVREDAGTNFVETTFGWCGQGVRGEVLDLGIQADHPDFDGLMLHGGNSTDSHGTSTYGIVFGNGARDGDGDAQGTGHMPCHEQGISADIDFLGDRFVHTQELLAAPYRASFQSNSWGAARDLNYTTVSQEMDDIIWRLDFPILQSQSNAGNQQSRPQAWAKNIISVGGIRHFNTLDPSDDAWNSGASIGPAADGRIKPDINYWYDSIYTTTTGSGYTSGFGGTSAATPESAGVLGLMLQMWADNVWETDPDGADVFEKAPHFSTSKALLINNAKQYPFTGTTHDLTRMHQGWGRPNAQIAQERALDSFIIDEQVVLTLGAPVVYDVDVAPGEGELKITLVYPDPPGITSASLHRINDVNLKVTSPLGDVYHGNVGLDVGTHSTPGGSPNSVDTVENVFVLDPDPGVWKVEIEAVEINQDAHTETAEDDVDFALVVTGGTGAICAQPLVDFTATPSPARVGETVTFDSTVSGGAGGPYTYDWDFENDGVNDDTRVDPTHVFTRPYDGLVKLKVRDSEACPETVRNAVSITGPDVLFEDIFELIEVEGNANGALDPGEVWDMRLTLRNDGNEPATGLSADIEIDPQNPGSLILQQASASYPDIPAGGSAQSIQAYRFSIGHDFPCGQDAVFTLTRIMTTDPANTYPDQPAVVRKLVGGSGPPVRFHFDSFETNIGWGSTGGGEWEFGAPQGLGGQMSIPGQTPKPDPSSAFDGNQVLGNDLSGQGVQPGNYENNTTTTMTSPVVDASDAVDVELNLARWLNTETNDQTYFEISVDGGVNWTRLFDDPGGITEQSWQQLNWDISAIADRQPMVQFRLGLTSDGVGVQGGWNIDALELVGVTRDSCEPFTGTSLGQVTGLTVDKAGAGTLQLSWAPDCGNGTSYGIYRGDLGAGYGSIAPEPGKCSVAGTSDTVPEGVGSADFFLVVPNDTSLEGFYGTDSSGAQRAPAVGACYGQDTPATCVP
jgi:hypothetical protein